MKSSRYLFGILFFLALMTTLLVLIQPIGPANSKISGYFSTPEGNVHYSQVTDGTNTSGYITIDNTYFTTKDIINYTFIASIYAEISFATDIEVTTQLWLENFTLLKGEISTITLNFNASVHEYPGEDIIQFYIKVSWGGGAAISDSHKLVGLKIGSSFEEAGISSLVNVLIVIMAIGMGILATLLVLKAKSDYHRYRRRRHPPTTPLPTTPSTPPHTISPPTSPTQREPLPVTTIELIPCPQCGSKIDRTQIICPSCGGELPKCVICNLVIESEDETSSCPECGARGHRTHLREWVHVKGYCPICKKRIDL